METEVITKELQAFNTTDAAIAELKQKYMDLTITGLEDTAGYKRVHEARMDIKDRRVKVTKKGKELREDAVAFQKAVIAEEKRIVGLLQPIEDHLNDEETRIDNEKERIKMEEQEKRMALEQARVGRLFDLGAKYNHSIKTYSRGERAATIDQIVAATDEQFAAFVKLIEDDIAQEKAAKEAEEKRLREEQERLDAEKKRLEAEEKRQKEERDKLEAEKKRLADEEAARKKAAEDAQLEEIRKKEEADRLEKAKREEKAKAREEILAAVHYEGATPDLGAMSDADWERLSQTAREQWSAKEEARIKAETEERLKKEAEEKRLKAEQEAKEKADREEKERQKQARKEARRPDKEKLMDYATKVQAIPFPEMKTEDGMAALTDISGLVETLIADIQSRVAQL